VFGLSGGEIAVILFLFAIIAAAGRMPRVGESIGEFLAGYRKGRRDDDDRGIDVRPGGRDG
jgi:Sec-independent protein translocase protein TatA